LRYAGHGLNFAIFLYLFGKKLSFAGITYREPEWGKKIDSKSDQEGGDNMSAPSAPYYYKEGSDTYHWETSCSKNHYPAQGWKKTNTRPSKEQCNECKSK
jgi:hypothetical protein